MFNYSIIFDNQIREFLNNYKISELEKDIYNYIHNLPVNNLEIYQFLKKYEPNQLKILFLENIIITYCSSNKRKYMYFDKYQKAINYFGKMAWEDIYKFNNVTICLNSKLEVSYYNCQFFKTAIDLYINIRVLGKYPLNIDENSFYKIRNCIKNYQKHLLQVDNKKIVSSQEILNSRYNKIIYNVYSILKENQLLNKSLEKKIELVSDSLVNILDDTNNKIDYLTESESEDLRLASGIYNDGNKEDNIQINNYKNVAKKLILIIEHLSYIYHHNSKIIDPGIIVESEDSLPYQLPASMLNKIKANEIMMYEQRIQWIEQYLIEVMQNNITDDTYKNKCFYDRQIINTINKPYKKTKNKTKHML